MKYLTLLFVTLITGLFTNCKSGNGSLSDSYQPVTAGSTWTYKIEMQGAASPEEVTTTIDNETQTYEGRKYYRAKTTFKLNDSITYNWLATSADRYYQRTIKPGAKFGDRANEELLYLDATKPVGANWERAADSLSVMKMGANMSAIAQVVEKDVSKTVNGIVFNHVIHSRRTVTMKLNMGMDLNMGNDADTSAFNLNNMSQTITADYYLAKGIGMIEMDMAVGKSLSAKQTLLKYNVK